MKYYLLSVLLCLHIFQAQAQLVDCPKPIIVGAAHVSNYQVMYPLGWSEKGDFAYLHQDINVTAGGGGFQYFFIVQNMKTDTILLKNEIYYDQYAENYDWEPFSTPIDSVASRKMAYFDYAFFKTIVWPKNRIAISNEIAKYKIKPIHVLFNNVLNLKEKGITLHEERIISPSQNLTTDYKIILDSEKKGEKTVYHWYCKDKLKACLNTGSTLYRIFKVKGFFMSPFENRIAIVVFREESGYGETDEFPFVVGADLENGYTKNLTKKK